MGYAKTPELGIETPEADQPPAITSDLKKLATQIEGFLLNQLTKGVELAKLKVTEKIETAALKVTGTLELPTASITGAMIGEGQVGSSQLHSKAVSSEKIASGLALVETENTYGALGTKALATEYEPSTTRFTFVVLTATKEATWNLSVFVGGVEIGVLRSEPSGTQIDYRTMSFMVPPGQKWKATSSEGSPVVYTSYLTL